jgi:hypothetical protein
VSLLLRQRKSYAEVAVLLGIAPDAVHDRAHAALAVLAPQQARELTPAERGEISDYMLAQQTSIAERLRIRTLLSSSEPAHAWAEALADELSSIAGVELPEIPPAAAAPAPPVSTAAPQIEVPAAAAIQTPPAPPTAPPPPPAAPQPPRTPPPAAASTGALVDAVTAAPSETQPRSSRLGGALLLGTIVIVAVVAVLLLDGGSGGSHNAKTTAEKSKSSTTSSAGKGTEKVLAKMLLRSPTTTSKSIGEAEVISDGKARGFAVATANLPPTKGFYYALWLYNSPTSAIPLARAPSVGSSHGFDAVALLPTYARNYREVLLTRETSSDPKTPGPVALRGTLKLSE